MQYRLWFGGSALASHERHDFERWLTEKSFSMLAPMCAVGLAVVALMLFVVDPVLFALGVWGTSPQHAPLVAWHAGACGCFLAFLLGARRAATPAARARILNSFFIASAMLFSLFAHLSWMLSGDLSTYAIFLLTMSCVFCSPGQLRKVLIAASTLMVVGLIFAFDQRDTFHTSGVPSTWRRWPWSQRCWTALYYSSISPCTGNAAMQRQNAPEPTRCCTTPCPRPSPTSSSAITWLRRSSLQTPPCCSWIFQDSPGSLPVGAPTKWSRC